MQKARRFRSGQSNLFGKLHYDRKSPLPGHNPSAFNQQEVASKKMIAGIFGNLLGAVGATSIYLGGTPTGAVSGLASLFIYLSWGDLYRFDEGIMYSSSQDPANSNRTSCRRGLVRSSYWQTNSNECKTPAQPRAGVCSYRYYTLTAEGGAK